MNDFSQGCQSFEHVFESNISAHITHHQARDNYVLTLSYEKANKTFFPIFRIFCSWTNIFRVKRQLGDDRYPGFLSSQPLEPSSSSYSSFFFILLFFSASVETRWVSKIITVESRTNGPHTRPSAVVVYASPWRGFSFDDGRCQNSWENIFVTFGKGDRSRPREQLEF